MLQEVAEWQPKMFDICGKPQSIPKYDHKIPISWSIVLIFGSACSLDSPLSNEIWQPSQFQETAKWQPERLQQLLFSYHSSTVVPSSLKNMPLKLSMSLSHFLEQVGLPYLIWKRRSWAILGYKILKFSDSWVLFKLGTNNPISACSFSVPASANILNFLVCHSVTPWSRKGYHTANERGHS